jgi:hypothetical protein
VKRPVQPCGTPAAYERHLYHHEIPDAKCLAANAARKMAERHGRSAGMEALFRELLDLISAECRRAGMLP